MSRLRSFLAALLLAPAVALGQSFQAGQDYQVLDEPQATEVEDRVEVREFFSYACPHCHTFKPLIQSLMDDLGDKAQLVHTPVVFAQGWEPLAKAYFTAESLGAVSDTHGALFHAVHIDNRQLGNADAIAEVMAEQGIAEEDFHDAWNSFSVDADMRRGERIARAYGVRSTPTVAVAGRYVVDVRAAGGQERMVEIIRFLVEKEYEDAQ
ncbi:thiol:disulfide interchange protein DsbA/DsbL [Aquisalimonas sp.]|uniref:thiol:disulfide interchange protein DsbA/DsbL n=1 Tax=Aquisalimonas sp. TaxID=1872621 RepID=UPI0025B98DA0|nr:thiol:disulfide interchange protein DsbA/DsbL [Aquisalimonas sp.]